MSKPTWLAAVAIVLAACSSGGSDESTAITQDDPAVTADATAGEATTATTNPDPAQITEPGTTLPMSPVTTDAPVAEVALVIDDETGLPVEVEQVPLGPLTYDEVVDSGVEAGVWSEADGLARAIGHAAGVVPDELVPGAESVASGAITGLLDRANALGASGELSDAETENLRIFYEAAMPTAEVRDRLVATAEPTSSVQGMRAHPDAGGLARQAQGSCEPVDPGNFSSSAWVEGCYRADVHDIAGHTVRILYPTWFDDDETLAGWPLFAFEVMTQSLATFAPLATIGDMDVVFSATDASSGVLGVAVADEQWGQATISGPCPIAIFPNAQSTNERFRQTLAHEVWHCVQHYSGGLQDFSTTRWFLEGAAEFFSNVVYPDQNEEHRWLNSFDARSRTKPLYDMDYQTWIWWQHLANRISPRAVADLNWEMIAAGDGGRALMAERAGEFQRFVVDFVAGKVADQSGADIRRAGHFNTPRVDVVKNDEGKTKSFETEPMVASRFMVRYEKQLRFLQSDQTTDAGGEHAMVEYDRRSDPAEWKQIHPEIRSTCDEPIWYIVVATSGEDPYEVKVQIDTTEQAVCDPCLLGTWSMQLDTFEAMLLNGIAAEGGVPAGVSFDIAGGEYLLAFNVEGGLTEQRAGLTVRAESAGQALTIVIDSFAEGDYQADGENISATNLVESSVNVSSGPASIFTSSGSTTSGSGTYECERDVLIVTVQGFDPVAFDRVDRILVPGDTIPG